MPVTDDAVEFVTLVVGVGRDGVEALTERVVAAVTLALSGEGEGGHEVLVKARLRSRRPFGELPLRSFFQSGGRYYKKVDESAGVAVEAGEDRSEVAFAPDSLVVILGSLARS